MSFEDENANNYESYPCPHCGGETHIDHDANEWYCVDCDWDAPNCKKVTEVIENPNVMIDLETIGNDYTGIFTTIGACVFNPLTGVIGSKFYESISWESAVAAGRTITPDTIKWWMEQSKDATREILADGKPLDIVLSDFTKFVPKGSKVWGNGCNFDIGKLETAYGYYNVPWKFYDIRDVRTVCELAKGLVDRKDVAFIGERHNALDDAIHQATYVSKMIMAIEELKNK